MGEKAIGRYFKIYYLGSAIKPAFNSLKRKENPVLIKHPIRKAQKTLHLLISNFHRVLNVVCFHLGDSPAFEFSMPTFRNTLSHLHRHVGLCTRTYLPMKMKQSVPKRRHINFRRWGITQKKAYNFSSRLYFMLYNAKIVICLR